MPPKRKQSDDDVLGDELPRKKPRTPSAKSGSAASKSKQGEVVEEKRLARFRPTCPKNIMERIERVKQQRFYMVERTRTPGNLSEQFKVLGSTGNVYTVTIKDIPTCNCPDFLKGNHCKHIIFVFLKILDVRERSHYYYQKALLTSELEDIFARAPPAPNSLVGQRVLDAYDQAIGRKPSSSLAEPPMRSVEGQNCPICYEEMGVQNEKGPNSIIFCKICRNGLHSDCDRMWKTRSATCVYCRAPVAEEPEVDEGYLNLSQVAGISKIRDTSTYYKGKHSHWRHSYY
ncbi:hypothetical protein CPB86DRAFT_780032 [Serendipita vermifera]|nr:hypothetical protein CPB86DRAFT_780032 [Serendipita vermifera]